jgi:hypothetical protein
MLTVRSSKLYCCIDDARRRARQTAALKHIILSKKESRDARQWTAFCCDAKLFPQYY